MGEQLVPRGGSVAHVAGGVLTTGGTARSTEPISFNGEIVTWEQLPAGTRRRARRRAPVVAEAVQVDPREWTREGRALQLATAWRVHEDAVVLAEVARPVAPAPAGGTRPVGPWEHRGLNVLAAVGPARRRRGVVDVADELGAPALGTGHPSRHGAAAEAWTCLPYVVRAAAERLVPEPRVWLGEMSQETTPDGFPARQDVRSLRMSTTRAVVVVATRSLRPIPGAGVDVHVAQIARVPWVVEQIGLDLQSDGTVRAELVGV